MHSKLRREGREGGREGGVWCKRGGERLSRSVHWKYSRIHRKPPSMKCTAHYPLIFTKVSAGVPSTCSVPRYKVAALAAELVSGLKASAGLVI
jgi:hypothetical protein